MSLHASASIASESAASKLSSTISTRRFTAELDRRCCPITSSGGVTRGKRSMKVEPRPTPALAALTVPPCISMRPLTIDSPIPSPPWARSSVRSDSTKRSNTCGSRYAGIGVFGCIVQEVTHALHQACTVAMDIERSGGLMDPQLMGLLSDDRLHCLDRLID